MKSPNILTTIILSAGLSFLTVLEINAQDCKCSENTAELQSEPTSLITVIEEGDYPYFLNVRNLKKYSNIKYDGTPIDNGYYSLRNYGKRAKLRATYGEDGNLINGRYIRINAPLPRAVRLYLVSDNYKGWTMTSNKIIVHDFNAHKTEYVVKIQKDNMKQILFFDHNGSPIKRLSRT